jgi:hypothetical protein
MKQKNRPLTVYDTTSFKKLKKEWYSKLAQGGWVDAEDDLERLTVYHNSKFSTDPLAFASQQRYYELAAQLLHSYKFESSLDKYIWTLHCQGYSNTSIAGKTYLTRYAVTKVINKLGELIKV